MNPFILNGHRVTAVGLPPGRPFLAVRLLLSLVAVTVGSTAADDASVVERLGEPGAVLLIRHVLARGLAIRLDFASATARLNAT